MRTTIGIDPGLSGGIAVIDGQDDVMAYPMPVIGKELDIQRIRDILMPLSEDERILVVIEKMQAGPVMGKTPTFRLGEQFGALKAICAVLDIPFVIVNPMEWKGKVLKGLRWKRKKGDTKKNLVSVQYVKRRYPKLNLLRTDKCTVPSDGMADAVCIALWAL